MNSRAANIDDVYRLAGEELAHRRTAEWIPLLEKLEIPSGPVKSLDEVMDDPHLAAIGFFRRLKHPTEGELVMPDVPLQFSDSPAGIERLPPRTGEHGREVLREIGLRDAEIDALATSGGVVMPADAVAAK